MVLAQRQQNQDEPDVVRAAFIHDVVDAPEAKDRMRRLFDRDARRLGLVVGDP